MAFLNGFNANDYEPAGNPEAIPAGKYLAAITESEMKLTKNGNGHYLELMFTVCDGQYKGRKVWARLNLDNPNPEAVQIANEELSAICRAVGVMQPNGSEDLHNLPLMIKVIRREHEGDFTNDIKAFLPRSSGVTPAAPVAPQAPINQPPAQQPATQQTQPADKGPAPWGVQ